MQTMTLSECLNKAQENKELAHSVVRNSYDSQFNYGDRTFDRPRRNPDKAKVLKQLEKEFNSRRKTTTK
ncbi:hypothetical protein PCV68_000954 [Staphylococcus pseudintermedius]|nr:hypothetical protein [Staphylococcus pseudintermedius]